MRIGFTLPQYGPVANRPADLVRFAAEAERLGADSLWVGDRLLSPLEPKIGYGLSGPGPFPPEFASVFDPFTALTLAASVTSRVRLGTNVLNAPFYSPLPLARTLTSIDRASDGRLVAGFGVGWSPDEFEAVGVPFAERGRRLDEILDVVEAAWTRDVVEHDSPLWNVPPSRIDHKPARRPPIQLGGFAPAALKRIGRRADGWLAAGMLPGMLKAEYLEAPLATIREAAAEAGRDPAAIEVVLRVNPAKGVSAKEIADATLAVHERIGLAEAFVELCYVAPETDHALELAEELLGLLR
ncbi:TIGR03619 family F420-dependent LLM class oxidoreductase [Kutzneria kofuensis]|uniref:Putative F420-dependent oxidoreductase n=1 Tax=Kutzneria kofuensis TaxID=103725 RepID=A0A7W9NIB1_9PSEU|nr:TIGR03619 family F420-dependent LLM class oxidoreductase [Kutzneria kofuensis]MBB5894382.1 putative F420-dependent oxidoreductase [Kutzneria kofuensis]